MYERKKLTLEYVIGINKVMQEVSAEADTIRYRKRLERVVDQINERLDQEEDSIKILAFILRTFAIEQIFDDANHRTAYTIFADYSTILKIPTLREKITLKDEQFIKYTEFLTQEQVEDILRKHLL